MLRRSILGYEDPDSYHSLPEKMVCGGNQFAHRKDDVPLKRNNNVRKAVNFFSSSPGTGDHLIGQSLKSLDDEEVPSR